jgi:alginate O-acetyltransferase complex protein AlgI
MSFTSFRYLIFIAVFCVFYFLLPGKTQKYYLLFGSYAFYMYARPAFGLLILAGTVVSYFCARSFEDGVLGRKRLWIAIGAVYTIGVLFVFKYLDFFCGTAMRVMGRSYAHQLALVLPVGISFFTFAVAGYLFDVESGKIKAERNFINFAVFVSFFPTIMAGPIGYARNFLPQLSAPKKYDAGRVQRGILRFTWGAAKKLVAADTLAIIVNTVYGDVSGFSNGLVLLAAAAYSLQIYFDFSAYTDMAVGTAEVLGFSVMENFRSPYLVTSVKEFWKKWHISLTSWLREYIYFPLGGSRRGKTRTYFNVLVVFAVSGLWHGAAFTFIIWGLLNGVYQVAGELTKGARSRLRAFLRIPEDSRLLWLWRCAVTFALVTVAWVFFRAGSVSQAVLIIERMLSVFVSGFGVMDFASLGLMKRQAVVLLLSLIPFVTEDIYIARGKQRPELEKRELGYWAAVVMLAVLIVSFGNYGEGFNPQDFVYFKF